MQALTKLTQKQINMQIVIRPMTLSLTRSEVNGGEPCNIFLRILRGPITWHSKVYEINSDTTEIQFNEEEFKKQCGFFFTKTDGAEFRKGSF